MFGSILRISAFPDDRDIEPAVNTLRGGGLVGLPAPEGYLVCTNADSEESVGALRRLAPGAEPALVVTSVPMFDRVFRLPAPLVTRARDTFLGLHTVIRLPHHRFPLGLPVLMVNEPASAHIIEKAGVPVMAVTARSRDTAGLLELASELARRWRGRIDTIVDAPREHHEIRERAKLVLMKSGIAHRDTSGEDWSRVAEGFSRNLLFVCLGNLNRSAFASARLTGLMREEEQDAREAGAGYLPAYRASSAGVIAVNEAVAPEPMVAASGRYGVRDLMESHRAHIFTREVAEAMHEVIPLAPDVARTLRQQGGQLPIARFNPELNLPDPMGSAPDAYFQCAEAVDHFIRDVYLAEGCPLDTQPDERASASKRRPQS